MDKLILNIKNFTELTRAYSLGMTLASCLVIFSYAFYSEQFTFLNFILLLIALCCVHMGANLFDCFIDVKTQLNKGISFENMVFSNERKARLIRNNTYSFKQVKLILTILFSIALLIGAYFICTTNINIIYFALTGALLTLLYPISSKFYLSEVIIGLIFGPLIITGGYLALCNDFNSNLFLLSWAIFFTTIILLHTHNIMDWEFDVKEGKNTLAILTKSKPNAIKALQSMIIAAYSIIVWGVIVQEFNPKMLYVFLTLPIATKLLESIKDYINIKDIKFEPKWYWGFFENWKEIQNRKIDYFMFRFYLARNFAFFFALFACVGAMLG